MDTQIQRLESQLAVKKQRLPAIEADIDSIERKIGRRQRKARIADDMRAAEEFGKRVEEVIRCAYATIKSEQVGELSEVMNSLFMQMAANVSDDDGSEGQDNRATLKMIAKIGLRPVRGQDDKYEIYALNGRGRAMPTIEINGASRRVLALSFVLSLCQESRTEAPLIADSLLNFMSGTVRRNTLRVTVQKSSQPILLLTASDLEAASEAEMVGRLGGATYTLTGQWDAMERGAGGDVVNKTEDQHIALVCECGAREYCEICERVDWSARSDWTKRA